MMKTDKFTLSNGIKIPSIGLGTWQADSVDCYEAVLYALSIGYRHIDTAFAYHNEAAVGKAIRDSGIPREEIFVTTKLPAEIKGYDATLEYFYKSKKNLGLDYVDLYLVHAPWPWEEIGKDCSEGNASSWMGFIDLYKKKEIRVIGVSNFHKKDIENLVEKTGFKPMVNQIRFFIGNQQKTLTEYCQKEGILVEAYSPFATGRILNHPLIHEASNELGISPTKLCLKFCLQKGTLPLPKSIHKERIKDNFDLNFEIPENLMVKLDELNGIDAKFMRS